MQHRLLDYGEDDLKNFYPLLGVFEASVLPFNEAMRHCEQESGLHGSQLTLCCLAARRAADEILQAGPDVLTADEIAAVNIYTQQTPFYRSLNERLRSRNRELLKPFFPILRLLLTGLHKLPPITGTFYRGVKLSLTQDYKQGTQVTWWSFTSTTSRITVLQSPQFLGDHGERTMFHLQVTRGLDIQKYSALPGEYERLVLPGSNFEVKSILHQQEMIIIQLEEAPEPTLLAGFAFLTNSQSPVATLGRSECLLMSCRDPRSEDIAVSCGLAVKRVAHVRINGTLIHHHAVYFRQISGIDHVIFELTAASEFRACSLYDFCSKTGPERVRVVEHGVPTPIIGPNVHKSNPVPIDAVEQVIERALTALRRKNKAEYHAVRYNSECFANWLLYGTWESRQMGYFGVFRADSWGGKSDSIQFGEL